jgi:hypothetical protein
MRCLPQRTTHARWIGTVLERTRTETIWLLDTDVVLWNKVEDLRFDAAIAGRRMPRFYCPYSRCWTETRLHTCLMFVDVARVRRELEERRRTFPDDFGSNRLVDPIQSYFAVSPSGERVYFDTCAQLSYQVSTQDFNEAHNRMFDHMNCGTYADVVEEAFPGLLETHRQIYANPILLRGTWIRQREFFRKLRLLRG